MWIRVMLGYSRTHFCYFFNQKRLHWMTPCLWIVFVKLHLSWSESSNQTSAPSAGDLPQCWEDQGQALYLLRFHFSPSICQFSFWKGNQKSWEKEKKKTTTWIFSSCKCIEPDKTRFFFFIDLDMY